MRASTPGQPEPGTWRRKLRWPGPGWKSSIRTRVLAIVLVPSAALLITGATVSTVLISDGVTTRNWAESLGTSIDPIMGLAAVAQQERTMSLRAIGGDPRAAAEMQAQRDRSDAVLNEVSVLAVVLAEVNPDAAVKSTPAFQQIFARLPAIRQGVDLKTVTAAEVDDFYSSLGGVLAVGMEGIASTTPDARAASAETSVIDMVYVTDFQSRAAGLAANATARGGVLGVPDRFSYTQFVGAYRHQLGELVSRLTDDERTRYNALVNSDAWKTATAAEDSLAQRGILPIGFYDWLNATNQVSTELTGLSNSHFRYAEQVAKDSADTTLLQSILAGIAVLLLGVGAFVVAILLANRLVRRLQSLREKTLELAQKKLPSLVERLREGERLDLDAEVDTLDHGADEIGQVAEAFNIAQRTAIAAAAAEAKTRGGINKVFLDIAHRSQIVVHRQLEVLDVAEAKQGDPEHLELLFQLDHLATHARRNAENLLILGGGQAGRKWRNPVKLEEIVRSAISETEEFARVSAVRLPDVLVLGSVVTDLIHLLAELVDNATSFSPPDSPVSVRGNLVGKGVVVEIEDQGLGIGFDEREKLNETLRNPPDFQEMALAGKRNLGLFVIGQLAQRHGIAVSLLESAYGGVKAIVLIPLKVIDSDAGALAEPAAAEITAGAGTRTGRHQKPGFVPEPAHDPVPRLPVAEDSESREWPTAESAWPPPTRRSPPATGNGSSPKPPARQRPQLPRRQRQANLAPQLRLDTVDADQAPPAESPRQLRSPEQARNSMASFQRGTRQARGGSFDQDNR